MIVTRVSANERGRVDVDEVLRELGDKGVTSLMCEGGPSLAEELAKADLIDEFVSISSSRELGRPGLAALGATLGEAISRNFVVAGEPSTFGEDRIIRHVESAPMFTGIVTDIGEVAEISGNQRDAEAASPSFALPGREHRARRLDRLRRALPHRRREGRAARWVLVRGRGGGGDARLDHARRMEGRNEGEPRALAEDRR